MRKIKLLLLLTLLCVGVSGVWGSVTYRVVYENVPSGASGNFTVTNSYIYYGQDSGRNNAYVHATKGNNAATLTLAYAHDYGDYNNPSWYGLDESDLRFRSSNETTYIKYLVDYYIISNITRNNVNYIGEISVSNTPTGQYVGTITIKYRENKNVVFYTWTSSPADIKGDVELLGNKTISYTYNSLSYTSKIGGPTKLTSGENAIYVEDVPFHQYTYEDTYNYTRNIPYSVTSYDPESKTYSGTPGPLSTSNINNYVKPKEVDGYSATISAVEFTGYSNTFNFVITYTPTIHSRTYTVSSNLSQGGIDGYGTWPHDEEPSLSGNTLTISTPSGSSYAPVALDNWNVNEYIIPKAVSGYKVTITVEGSTIKLNYYKTWVKDGLEYSSYHIQSSSNQGMMDEKFDFIPNKPELAVRLYLDQTKTVTDTVKYENPLWENPEVGDYQDLTDDDGDGVGTTARFTYLGQLDAQVEGHVMNRDYFYTRRHQIAYSERTSVTIPREVTFDGTTYKVTAIQKWGMDYTQTHIWLSDYCYNMNENGGAGQDKTTKVTEHQNINDHRNEYLTTVNFEMSADAPSNVASIGDYAFMSLYNTQNKTGMTDIIIPNSVTYLGAGLFECCLKLTNVTFQRETKVKDIRDYAFWCCVDLKEVTLPDGIETIGDCSFQYNFQMTKIELPNTLKTIGDHFLCCNSSLRTLTIPFSVEDIAGACFHGCESLTDVYLMGPASALKKESGSGGTFDANPRFCKDHVQKCTFHVFSQYYDSYAGDEVWSEIDEDGETDGRVKNGHRCINGNKLEVVPNEKRTFEADKWVTAIFPNGVEDYKTVFAPNGEKQTRVAVLTGASVTEGQDEDPKTHKRVRMYNLKFDLIDADDIPAKTPVMICPATTTEVTLYLASQADDDAFKAEMTEKHPVVIDCGEYGTVTMKGQYSPYDLKTWDFFFSYNQKYPTDPAKFYRVPENSNYVVDRCRCWWTIDVNGIPDQGTMGAKNSSIFVDDETSDINDIDYRVTIGGIYDLNGRKLDVAPEDLPQGIFIVNGKKHVVK